MSFFEKLLTSSIKRLLRTDKQKARDLINIYRYQHQPLTSLRAEIKKRHPEANFSFSQSGEDMVIDAFFLEQEKGFYVDVGANHPVRFSNTYHFYLKGWRGLTIDANPEFINLFGRIRPDDIAIKSAVGRPGIEDFFVFEESCYNTFDREIANEIVAKQLSRLSDTLHIKKSPLSEILDSHIPEGQRIDFLTIDCEGLDVEILESNNWERYRPEFICAECHDSLRKTQDGAHGFLYGKGYHLVAKTKLSELFKLA